MLVHWGLSFQVLSFLVAWIWSKEVSKLYVATFLYLTTLANVVICFRGLGATLLNPLQLTFLLSTTSFAAYLIGLYATGALYVRRLDCEQILKVSLMFYGLVGALLFIAGRWKLIPHLSSNATMMALSLPYFLSDSVKDWKKHLAVFLILVGIIDSNASSPIGVASVVIGAYFFLSGRRWLVFAALVPLLFGVLYYGAFTIFDDTSRFKAYQAFMGYWWNDRLAINLFGYGPGSFEILSQIIQEKLNFMVKWHPDGRLRGNLWMHMHSDLLQFLFEYGIIGATLIVACGIKLLFSLKGLIKEQVILLGAISSMIFDFPLRYPGVPLVLVLLFGIMVRHDVSKVG